MHLFETENGDKWVCRYCVQEEEKMIKEKGWEYIFDRDDTYLLGSLCGKPEDLPDD